MKQFDTNTGLFNKLPKDASVYRHFKGGFYKVTGLGFESETKCWKVVYRSAYPEVSEILWVQDAETFLSPTDKVKYPYADQSERFKCVDKHISDARHAVGLDYGRYKRRVNHKIYYTAHRNYFCTCIGDPTWEDMVSWGFAELWSKSDKFANYGLTKEGKKWLCMVCDDVDVIKEAN